MHSREREQHVQSLRGTKGPGMSEEKFNAQCGCGIIWGCREYKKLAWENALSTCCTSKLSLCP